MKIKLILVRQGMHGETPYPEVKIIDADIPLDKQHDWQVIGAEWPDKVSDKN